MFLKKIDCGFISIFIVLVLTMYFSVTVLKYPLIGIELEKKDNQWVIEKVYESVWASSQSIEEGDIVVLVNGKTPAQHAPIKYLNKMELANSIVIIDKEFKITKTYSISYSEWDAQYITYLFFPLLFVLMILMLSVFLYRRKKDEKSAILLIYFLLALGTSYLSASVSARGDLIGYMVNTITFPGSLILFIHFLTAYLVRFNLQFVKSTSLVVLYVLGCFDILVVSIDLLFKLPFQLAILKLLFFLLLIGYLIAHLIRLYVKSRQVEGNNVIKILIFTLLAAFSPFVCFYLIPTVLFNKELVSAEVTAAFLLVIPIMFVYLQLTKKLFDIDFLLNRFRYYSLLSLVFTGSAVLLVNFVLKKQIFSSEALLTFCIVFICTVVFLYIKEHMDYKIQHHLFSPKGNYGTSLYTFFQLAKFETKVNSFISNLINEMKEVLLVERVIYMELYRDNEGTSWQLQDISSHSKSFVEELEKVNWNNYRAGSLYETVDGFGIVIGGDHLKRIIISCGMKKSKTNLNIQERVWLETLAYFSSILLENFQLIEGLVEKIEEYKDQEKINNSNYPLWFSKLMFSLSEKERTNLSIDLHDSVLQEQLQLLREIEMIKGKVEDEAVKNDLMNIKEKVLDSVHLIRETCNELRPPFLNELGIVPSIQILIDQTRLRADFIIRAELDSSIRRLHNECELTLYRLVQELLNNAIKHSSATEVVLSLYQNAQTLFLVYSDNGKGMDITQLNDSFQTMGVFGMKERVKSIGGTVEIHSVVGNGLQVQVEIQVGGG